MNYNITKSLEFKKIYCSYFGYFERHLAHYQVVNFYKPLRRDGGHKAIPENLTSGQDDTEKY